MPSHNHVSTVTETLNLNKTCGGGDLIGNRVDQKRVMNPSLYAYEYIISQNQFLLKAWPVYLDIMALATRAYVI